MAAHSRSPWRRIRVGAVSLCPHLVERNTDRRERQIHDDPAVSVSEVDAVEWHRQEVS
jgi:hypothetical protein